MLNPELLIGKLEGTLSAEKEADFQDWLQSSDENLRFFQKLETLKREGKSYHLYESIDVESAWQEVLRKQAQLQSPIPALSEQGSRPFFVRYQTGLIAAMIAVLVVAVVLLNDWQMFSGELRRETGFGEKMTFVLPDQSKVILNANSSLRYHKDQPRKIWLKGEAYFQVSKKQKTKEKFWVITPDLTIEVLGTAFNVNSHQEKTRVSLEEGSIKLESEK